LRETQRHVDPNILVYRNLCSPQALVGAGILDVSVWNPGEHFQTLGNHLFSRCMKVCEYLYGNTGIFHEWGYSLHNLLVFVPLLFGAQSMTGRKELLNLRILGN
jgi:hypothetical protein